MTNLDIETFWAVVQHGTMTAAAEALFITQPTLTNRIQALEAEVGAQLFRRGKGIRHIGARQGLHPQRHRKLPVEKPAIGRRKDVLVGREHRADAQIQ